MIKYVDFCSTVPFSGVNCSTVLLNSSKKYFLPVSHVLPVKPGLHVHVNKLVVPSQEALFLHGLVKQTMKIQKIRFSTYELSNNYQTYSLLSIFYKKTKGVPS